MLMCDLEWIDFATWFGANKLFIERIQYDKEWWYNTALPKIDFFYTRAILPEVFTRRVERVVRLHNHGG